MPIKKSELYSSLWASCDELRGGMDASQYKDYVLVLLFIKYVSDKYAGQRYSPITIPPGSTFADMVALKGKPDIGNLINTLIIQPLLANNDLGDLPDFNDDGKLGTGKEKVDRLTSLIGIFQNPALDFSNNRAEGDDILGDAYEYLMRHFATESGKSKGQFYTPAEVSRIMAQVIGIGTDRARNTGLTTVYDPTCGSGSLLLKVADEAGANVSLYGQEKDSATSSLARMNMYLHNNPTATIRPGNTLASPQFFADDGSLKTFDYVVANPPFSDKRWGNGVDTADDPHTRFTLGVPPPRQGDYAYLLHIVRSLKQHGKGACILPHGVLFRGGAEGAIRRNLVDRGYLKGIIGLPANLFYGTGIPACIVVLDKENASTRRGIFVMDASKDFLKEGPKNRLRAMDIHRIVDVFNRREDVPGFSRMVGVEEISRNGYNLNLPRYIDSLEHEDAQDIEGHLRGGIPEADLDSLERFWSVCPALRNALFSQVRSGYVRLEVAPEQLKQAIAAHPEFAAYAERMAALFADWRAHAVATLRALGQGCHPRAVIRSLSETLLQHYTGRQLVDRYDVYQHMMDYWAQTMSDDCYAIGAGGWKAEPVANTKGRGWSCDLVPKPLIVARYFGQEQATVDAQEAEADALAAQIDTLEEEHGGDEGILGSLGKPYRKTARVRLDEMIDDVVEKMDRAEKTRKKRGTPKVEAFLALLDNGDADEGALLTEYLDLLAAETAARKAWRAADTALDAQCFAKYLTLTEGEIKALVVEDKWLDTIEQAVLGEMGRVREALTRRVRVLEERYRTPLPQLTAQVEDLEAKVRGHLERMGIAWQ